ncbi:MAG: DivIVA domain-containing protein [Clostridia bacterium]|nr:DivIVA domain-containing protein [Clostridia bacterium]MBQ7046774.1 DivIVA domain-containing protein [Oscillospiraceae bacterium]
MLKPEQLKAHRFNTVSHGTYEADSVDSFFAEVTASYEQMFRENGELVKKISLLAERVSQYKNDEDNIRRALLTAERMADKIQREAQQVAQEHLDNAEKKASEIVTAAQNRADVVETAASVNASRLTEESQKAASERLTNAERTATILITDAERKAADIIESSKSQAQAELDRITADIKANSAALNILSDEVTRFKSSLLEVYREHIELITSLPKKGEDLVKEEPKAEDSSVEETPEVEETAVEETTAVEYTVAEVVASEPVEEEPVAEEETSSFDEELSEETHVSAEASMPEEVEESEETDATVEDEVYNPIDVAFAFPDAAQEPVETEEEAEDNDEVIDEEFEKEKENYLRGFVIDLNEIENTIDEDKTPEKKAETVVPQPVQPPKKESETYSKFRGFFKK